MSDNDRAERLETRCYNFTNLAVGLDMLYLVWLRRPSCCDFSAREVRMSQVLLRSSLIEDAVHFSQTLEAQVRRSKVCIKSHTLPVEDESINSFLPLSRVSSSRHELLINLSFHIYTRLMQ